MTSNTETTSTVTETINSMNYDTGYQYVITGTNISHDGTTISAPNTTGNSNTLNGVTSTWTNLDINNKPNFTITTLEKPFNLQKVILVRAFKSHNNKSHDNYTKRHKYNKHLLKLISICLLGSASPTFASDIGGVSATANPVANSSGSVTNQAIQVLQGPYITNTYGNGIQCQGPTMNVTPFLTGNIAIKRPYEDYWQDPVYNNVDANNDDVPDNPGEILYYKPVKTGQKDSSTVSLVSLLLGQNH